MYNEMIRFPTFLIIILTLFPKNNNAQTGISPTTNEPTLVIYLDDNHPEVSWTPNLKPSVIIETDRRFIISVKIEYCDLDGENGENVAISTGKANETLLFTYGVKNKPTYLFRSHKLYVDFVGTHLTNFNATFTRIGEALTTTTTTEVPTTRNYPTASSNYSDYLTVFIAGKSAEEYKTEETKHLFRRIVIQMAAEYTDNENFDLTHNITEDNVYISQINPCPTKWTGHETCSEITFSVPVFLNESSDSRWTGYQLSSSHLKIMWSRYSEKYFNDVLTIYVEPQLQSMLTSRIILISIVTIVFVLGLLAVRFTLVKMVKRRRSESVDKTPIISNATRDSSFDLYPHPYQDIPALFKKKYSEFNPEKGFEEVPTVETDNIRRGSEQLRVSGDIGVSTA
ncbi:unnamed protein product [Phaedon cochleariae]|uniref:Uncharacterized protein n=1 Tax=Phaedon cochleariae TaxID=80249 RepID=A0A9P0DPX4_PHACE|nr:unnamed protein product [Phaedon cochleariae]